MRYLGFGEGRIAGAEHRRLVVDLPAHLECVASDELSFAVEVGGDDDGVGLLRQVLEAADDVLLLGQHLHRRVDQIRQRVHLPRGEVHAVLGEGLLLLEGRTRQALGHVRGHHLAVRIHAAPPAALLIDQLGGEVGFENVAAQADGDPFLALHREAVHRGVVDLVALGLARLEQVGDLLGSVVLLCDNQLHAKPLS